MASLKVFSIGLLVITYIIATVDTIEDEENEDPEYRRMHGGGNFGYITRQSGRAISGRSGNANRRSYGRVIEKTRNDNEIDRFPGNDEVQNSKYQIKPSINKPSRSKSGTQGKKKYKHKGNHKGRSAGAIKLGRSKPQRYRIKFYYTTPPTSEETQEPIAVGVDSNEVTPPPAKNCRNGVCSPNCPENCTGGKTPAPGGNNPPPKTPAPWTPAPKTPAPGGNPPAPKTPAPWTPDPKPPAPGGNPPAPKTPAPWTPDPKPPAPGGNSPATHEHTHVERGSKEVTTEEPRYQKRKSKKYGDPFANKYAFMTSVYNANATAFSFFGRK